MEEYYRIDKTQILCFLVRRIGHRYGSKQTYDCIVSARKSLIKKKDFELKSCGSDFWTHQNEEFLIRGLGSKIPELNLSKIRGWTYLRVSKADLVPATPLEILVHGCKENNRRY